MNNPFDLENYKRQVDFSPLEKARRNAYQASRAVNESRRQGIEPSAPYSERKDLPFGIAPTEMVVEMPEMPVNKKTLRRRIREGR